MGDIDEVKTKTNIIDVIGARVTLKKSGRNFKGLCPFHNEKTPSFMVSPERQVWHCFGCARGGSVIDFVMENERIDFVEALEQLAEKAGVTLERRAPDSPQSQIREKIYEVNHLASEYYHYILTKHPMGERARTYLKKRGISEKSITTFHLGYSPNSWDGLGKFLQKKGYDDSLVESAGLIIKRQGTSGKHQGYYDRFRGRVMFTLRDHRGNYVGFSGRLLDANAKEAKYINTSETPVYIKGNVLYGLDVNKEAIQKSGEAILMEGEVDVISCFQEGISNAVAIKGSALTEAHVGLLRRFTSRILFALDGDIAGDAASRRGIEIAERAGLDMKVVVLPGGKDPDEIVRSEPQALKSAVQTAIPIYDYFLSSALTRYDASSASGKKQIAQEVLPVYAKIDNAIVQAHYAKKLAGTLDVTEETIFEELKKAITAQAKMVYSPKKNDSPPESGTPQSQREKVELYMLSLILQGKTREFYEEITEHFSISDILHPAIRRIFESLQAHLSEHRIFLLKDFADSLPKELVGTFDEAFLWDMSDIADDEHQLAKEWSQTVTKVQGAILRQKIHEISKLLHDQMPAHEAEKLHEELRTHTSLLKALDL